MNKNIFILPATKLTKLGFIYELDKYYFFKTNEDSDNLISNFYKNIYITDESKIKKGDWFIHSSHGQTSVYQAKSVADISIITTCNSACWAQYCKKIVLTTNDSLFKYDVKEIKDEFLEWFIKNSDCEEVKIIKQYNIANLVNYKIIIQEEEILKNANFMKSTIDLLKDECYQISNFVISFDEINNCIIINSVNPRDLLLIEPATSNTIKIHAKDYRKWKNT